MQSLAYLLDQFQEWRDKLPSSLADSAAAEAWLFALSKLRSEQPAQRSGEFPTATFGEYSAGAKTCYLRVRPCQFFCSVETSFSCPGHFFSGTSRAASVKTWRASANRAAAWS